jgi:hypothetical protein
MNVSLYHSFFHDYNLSRALYFAELMPPSLLMFLAFIFYFLQTVKCMLKFCNLKFRFE